MRKNTLNEYKSYTITICLNERIYKPNGTKIYNCLKVKSRKIE